MHLHWPAWLYFLLLGVFLVAAGLTIGGAISADGKGSDVALEVAKAGLQLGAIIVLGFVVTEALKVVNDERERRGKEADAERERRAKEADAERERRAKQADVEREERQRLNEYRMVLFRETVDAYNRVKAVRRALRAIGMDRLRDALPSQEQLAVFDREMRTLNEAELALERIEREVTAQRETFPHASSQINDLNTAQNYLRNVLTVWESRAFLTTDRNTRQETSVADFGRFVAKRGETVKSTFWPSFKTFEGKIREDLLEAPAPPDQPARA
jgi:hypothetical protein